MNPGLYLVSTPIGNLSDWTFRAQDCINQADLVLCEDTRVTQKLLNHYRIKRKTLSYHDHNNEQRLPLIEQMLNDQKSVALVSDSGTPLISDPGYPLVQLAIKLGVHIYPVPGASALLAGLVASGLPTDHFSFIGFPPRKNSECIAWLKNFSKFPGTLVMYESPHRILHTLSVIHDLFQINRKLCLARELTKFYEEIIRGTAQDCLQRLTDHPESQRGEFVLMLGPDESDQSTSAELDDKICVFVNTMKNKISAKDMIDALTLFVPLPRKTLYEKVHYWVNNHEP